MINKKPISDRKLFMSQRSSIMHKTDLYTVTKGVIIFRLYFILYFNHEDMTQSPRTDLDKKYLPRPKTNTA